MYESWFPPQDQAGKTLLLVGWSPEAISGERIERQLQRYDSVRRGVLQCNGHFIKYFYYRVGYGYRAQAPVATVRTDMTHM
jgi:hypothetical protein